MFWERVNDQSVATLKPLFGFVPTFIFGETKDILLCRNQNVSHSRLLIWHIARFT